MKEWSIEHIDASTSPLKLRIEVTVCGGSLGLATRESKQGGGNEKGKWIGPL
jgi:hypothetical protein